MDGAVAVGAAAPRFATAMILAAIEVSAFGGWPERAFARAREAVARFESTESPEEEFLRVLLSGVGALADGDAPLAAEHLPRRRRRASDSRSHACCASLLRAASTWATRRVRAGSISVHLPPHGRPGRSRSFRSACSSALTRTLSSSASSRQRRAPPRGSGLRASWGRRTSRSRSSRCSRASRPFRARRSSVAHWPPRRSRVRSRTTSVPPPRVPVTRSPSSISASATLHPLSSSSSC